MNKLNLEEFNNIIFKALKDQSIDGQINMIKQELSLIADVFFHEMADLMDELEENGYESEQFSKLKNIKDNSEGLVIKLMELEKQKESQEK